jgi:hypothetical protein
MFNPIRHWLVTSLILASASACSTATPLSAESAPALSSCSGGLIQNERDLSRFSGCRLVEGDLEITDSTLQNLDGLAGIRQVSGRLVVSDNPSLEDLSGLQSLESVGSLEISQNQRLATTSGLDALRSVRELRVERNPKLISLGGLSGLERVHSVRIANNPRVCAQMGLLPDIRDVEELVVTDNAGLSSTDVGELFARARTTPRTTPDTIETPTLVAASR